MIIARSFARQLATAGPRRRASVPYGLGLDLQPSARSRAGHISSRHFASGSPSNKSEKYQGLLMNISAGLGGVSTLATFFGGVGYCLIDYLNRGVDKKIRDLRDATNAMLIAEKDRREAFQASVSRFHLTTFGTLDDVIADLRERFSELVDRCLELDALEASYRVQILRAEVVLERKGITSSSEVHKELVPKINQLQDQIDLLTEEVAKLGLLVQDYAPAALALAVGQNEKGAAAVGNVENYAIGAAVAVAAALATGENEKRAAVYGFYDKVVDSNGYATAASSVSTQHEKTAVPVGITDAAKGFAAATRMTEKGPVSTEMENAESEAENRKPQERGGSGSV